MRTKSPPSSTDRAGLFPRRRGFSNGSPAAGRQQGPPGRPTGRGAGGKSRAPGASSGCAPRRCRFLRPRKAPGARQKRRRRAEHFPYAAQHRLPRGKRHPRACGAKAAAGARKRAVPARRPGGIQEARPTGRVSRTQSPASSDDEGVPAFLSAATEDVFAPRRGHAGQKSNFAVALFLMRSVCRQHGVAPVIRNCRGNAREKRRALCARLLYKKALQFAP